MHVWDELNICYTTYDTVVYLKRNFFKKKSGSLKQLSLSFIYMVYF